jgi:hypothetical protein
MTDILETPDFNGSASGSPENGYVVVGLQVFTYTGGIVEYTILKTGFYFVSAVGPQGGASGEGIGGYGAGVGGEVYLTQGTELDILVGGAGASFSSGGGGGGGSFVWDPASITLQSGVPEPSSVPAPSTWPMMLIGFAALGFVGYRKMKLG